MNRLYWVRHGENLANLTTEFSCRNVDYSLTAKGVLQAQQTGEHFKDEGIEELYCSPLKRTVETARLIGREIGLEPVVMEHFREVNVGALEGRPPTVELWQFHNDIITAWWSGQPETAFPEGEDYFTLWGRMRDGLTAIFAGKTGRRVMIVGHGGNFKFTLAELVPGIDVPWLRSHHSPNCSFTTLDIEVQDGRPVAEVVDWGYHAHLHGTAAKLVTGMPPLPDK